MVGNGAAPALTWSGDVVTGEAASAVLARMVVLDRSFTKTTGVQSDGKSEIWLVEVDGRPAILKRTAQFYRSLRCQICLDELKPLFGTTKIGSVLVAPANERPTLLMRFVGDGTALISVDQDEWLWDAGVIDQLARICVFDMVVANSSRKGRNILWARDAAGGLLLVPIDEEQAMDFRITPEFRMNAAVRKRLTMVNLEPLLATMTFTAAACRQTAERYYAPDHAVPIAELMAENWANVRQRYFKYLDTSYGHATRSGVPSRSKQGPRPWEAVP